MRRIIDLSTPIVENHFRWRVDRELKKSYAAGDYLQATRAGWIMHGFTHMDTPRHFDRTGFTTDEVTPEMTVGDAAVVDISDIAPNTAIGAEMVARAGSHIREGDIVLMRAGWDQKESIDTPEFWTRAPYMTREACEWLLARKIKANAHSFAGRSVMLIGAGGAGSAIGVAIAFERPASVRIFDTDADRAQALVAKIRGIDGAIDVDFGQPTLAGRDYLINATPLGMMGDPRLPIATESLPPELVVLDAVTKPEQTPLLALAQASGCRTLRGRQMMHGQIGKIVNFFEHGLSGS